MSIERIIERQCKQTAVYWGNPVPDGFGGMTYDAPREIKCRWESKQELIISKSENPREENISHAQLFVLEDLQESGYVYLGTLESLSQTEHPEKVERAYKIKKFEKIPAYKSDTVFLRKVYL